MGSVNAVGVRIDRYVIPTTGAANLNFGDDLVASAANTAAVTKPAITSFS
jgi:hypothetical protein